jgi:hypothetical protein
VRASTEDPTRIGGSEINDKYVYNYHSFAGTESAGIKKYSVRSGPNHALPDFDPRRLVRLMGLRLIPFLTKQRSSSTTPRLSVDPRRLTDLRQLQLRTVVRGKAAPESRPDTDDEGGRKTLHKLLMPGEGGV